MFLTVFFGCSLQTAVAKTTQHISKHIPKYSL